MNFLVPIEEITISFILTTYKKQDEKHKTLIRNELNKMFVERQVPIRLEEVREQKSKTQDTQRQIVSKPTVENFTKVPLRATPNFLNLKFQPEQIKNIESVKKDDLPKEVESRFMQKIFNNKEVKSQSISESTKNIEINYNQNLTEQYNTLLTKKDFENPRINNSNVINNIETESSKNNKNLFNFLLSISKQDKSNEKFNNPNKIEQSSLKTNTSSFSVERSSNLPKPDSGLAELININKELSVLENEKRLMIELEAESSKTKEEKNRKIKEIQDKYDQLILSRGVEIDMYNNEVIKYVKSVMDWETWDNVYNERINRLETQMKDIKKSITNILENNSVLSEKDKIELDYYDKSLYELLEESKPESLLRYIIKQFKEEKVYQLDFTQLSKNNFNFEDLWQDNDIYGYTDSLLEEYDYDSENESSILDTSINKPVDTYINKNTDFYQMLAKNTVLDFGKLQIKNEDIKSEDIKPKEENVKKEVVKPKVVKREKFGKQNSESKISPLTPKEKAEKSERSKNLTLQKSEPLISPRSVRSKTTVEISNPIGISSLNQLDSTLMNAIKYTAKPARYNAKVTLMFVKFKDNMELQSISSDINFIIKKLDDIIKIKEPLELSKGQLIYKGKFYAYERGIISVIIDLDSKLLRKIVKVPPHQKDLIDYLVVKDTNINLDEKTIKELSLIL